MHVSAESVVRSINDVSSCVEEGLLEECVAWRRRNGIALEFSNAEPTCHL